MKRIIENPDGYMFPNYCFTKRFLTYYFFVPRMIYQTYNSILFSFLENLELNFHDGSNENWEFFAVGVGVSSFKKGDEPAVSLNFEDISMTASLREIESVFSRFTGKYGWDFVWSYRIFWMNYQDKIQVYVNDDAEIVVVGVDLENDIIRIDQKIKSDIFSNFGYEGGFLEYANGYGKYLLELTNKQIKHLNNIFTLKS